MASVARPETVGSRASPPARRWRPFSHARRLHFPESVGNWLPAMRRYAAFVAFVSAFWETAQIPLYAISRTGTPSEIALAVAHRTVGDVLVAFGTLAVALIAFGRRSWPTRRFTVVAMAAVALGVGYAAWGEWADTALHASPIFTDAMPRVPLLGTPLSTLLQWLVVPTLGLRWAARLATR